MIDLETLSSSADGVIVSVGAVKFDLEKLKVLDEKYWELDLDEQYVKGRTLELGNVKWFLNQCPEVRRAATNTERYRSLDFISEFQELSARTKRYWAKGAHFDLRMLNNYFATFGKPIPTKYSQWMCMKPVYLMSTRSNQLPVRSNTAHHALADAEYQTEVLLSFYNNLRGM